jgi:hypothetical protein
MADPLSIANATVGFIDVCWRVGAYLKDVKDAAGRIEGDIGVLQRQVTSLIEVDEAIEKLKVVREGAGKSSPINYAPEVESLWQNVDSNRKGCREAMLRLEEKVLEIMGRSQTAKPTGKIDGIRKALRMQATDPDLAKVHNDLSKYQQSLQILLSALNV